MSTMNNLFVTFSIILILVSQPGPARTDESLNDYLTQVINNLKSLLPKGDPDLKIPPMDPYYAKDINEHINSKKVLLDLKLNNLVVTGVSKFQLVNLDVDMQNLALKVKVVVPEISNTAKYDIKGTAMKFLPIYGNGDAKISVKGFSLDVNAGLKIDIVSGQLGITNFDMKIDISSVSIFLENILGGGSLGDLVNVAINALAKPMFDKHKPDIEKLIHKTIPPLIEKELKKVDIRKIISGMAKKRSLSNEIPDSKSINSYVDKLLANLRADTSLSIDPLLVENQRTKTAGIKVEINNGRVYGLRSLHRVGSMKLDCAMGTECRFTGELGVDNINAKFDTQLKLLFVKLRPSLNVKVNELRVQFQVRLNLAAPEGQQMAFLEEFRISKFSTPKLDIGHLGPFGKILSWISRVIVPLVKGKISNAVEKPIKKALTSQLVKLRLNL